MVRIRTCGSSLQGLALEEGVDVGSAKFHKIFVRRAVEIPSGGGSEPITGLWLSPTTKSRV